MSRRTPTRDDRATTAVVGVVLLVGLTVSLAAVVLGTAGSFETNDPPPTVGHSTGTFETGPSVGCDDNVVRVVHEGGDPVAPADLAVVVSLPATGATARLRSLPVSGTQLQAENVVADDHNVVYDNCVGGVLDDGGDTWVAGTALAFELNAGGGTVQPGDPIEVTVVHEPTSGILAETVVVAT